MPNKNRNKKISAFTVVEIVVIIILILMIGGIIACNVIFHNDSKAASVFGLSFYKTKAVNMLPEIPVNSVIVAKKSEIPNINQGSVILCNIGGHTALTRVKELQSDGGMQYYIVQFDTSPDNETFRISSGDVIAKAVWQLDSLGKFLDFATSVPGIALAAMIPVIFIIIFQALKMRKLRKLEIEASMMDDGLDEIFSRDDNTEPEEEPVVRRAVKDNFDFVPRENAPSDNILTVDKSGKADFVANKFSPEENSAAASGLFTYNRESGKVTDNSNVSFANKPTKISFNDAVNKQSDDSRENKVSFKDLSFSSNVIPDKLAGVQEMAVEAVPKDCSIQTNNVSATGFDAYFEKKAAVKIENAEMSANDVITAKTANYANDNDEAETIAPTPVIPEKAVVPKENLAPVKKKNTSKTLAELMSMIDSEESKLKK